MSLTDLQHVKQKLLDANAAKDELRKVVFQLHSTIDNLKLKIEAMRPHVEFAIGQYDIEINFAEGEHQNNIRILLQRAQDSLK